VIQVIR